MAEQRPPRCVRADLRNVEEPRRDGRASWISTKPVRGSSSSRACTTSRITTTGSASSPFLAASRREPWFISHVTTARPRQDARDHGKSTRSGRLFIRPEQGSSPAHVQRHPASRSGSSLLLLAPRQRPAGLQRGPGLQGYFRRRPGVGSEVPSFACGSPDGSSHADEYDVSNSAGPPP